MAHADRFQVDLHGVVDLLAQHIYSSPRVFVRELLQNAVDAITARRLADPDAPSTIEITADGSSIVVRDSGIGLAPHEVEDVLATIGRSSKRDEIGLQREEFLGQFGVGLLSAFMVADRIEIVTRPSAGPTTRWVGHAGGHYETTEVAGVDHVGTTVTLVPRHDARPWFDPETVKNLVATFGSALEADITVNGVSTRIGLPWEAEGGPGARRASLVGYAQDELGFTPFDVIDLEVPALGLRGVAFVVPYAVNPTERPTHRVYLKRMLLSENVDRLVPTWAYFVRCVVDTSGLRPVASREGLVDDDALTLARTSIGQQVRSWLTRMAAAEPRRMRRFISTHQLGIKALATQDDAMLELVDRWIPLETTQGPMSAEEFRSRHGELAVVETLDAYRQIASVAAAQGVALINGGYTYDTEIVTRIAAWSGTGLRLVEPSELSLGLDVLSASDERAMSRCLSVVREALSTTGCDVVVRAFDPASLPVLHLVDRDAGFSLNLKATRERTDGLWSEVLGVLDQQEPSAPQLVLNHRNVLVRRLASLEDDSLVALTARCLYGQALLAGQQPLSARDGALLNQSLAALLERALEKE